MSMPKQAIGERHEQLKAAAKEHIDTNLLKAKFDTSHFDINAILRGMQLTLVGAHRALQNPALFTNSHYKQAASAVVIGILIRLLVSLPIVGVRVLLWAVSLVYSLDNVQWDDSVANGLNFVEEYVLQVPFFLMTLMRYIDPTLDNLFMESLQWVDLTYVKKHQDENPDSLRNLYYPNLKMYKHSSTPHSSNKGKGLYRFIYRFAKKGAISLAIFGLSFLPVVGRIVLPAASFYTFNQSVGLGPASITFGVGVFLPRRYLIIFLQTYFSSKSLMRELLEPYFSRIHFSKEQKKAWFRSREGVLFGFGLGFYILVKVPLVGVLIYGIAEASTAYLVTKVTDPPPSPKELPDFAASQQEWQNKHEFLSLSLANLDHIPSGNTADSTKA